MDFFPTHLLGIKLRVRMLRQFPFFLLKPEDAQRLLWDLGFSETWEPREPVTCTGFHIKAVQPFYRVWGPGIFWKEEALIKTNTRNLNS